MPTRRRCCRCMSFFARTMMLNVSGPYHGRTGTQHMCNIHSNKAAADNFNYCTLKMLSNKRNLAQSHGEMTSAFLLAMRTGKRSWLRCDRYRTRHAWKVRLFGLTRTCCNCDLRLTT
jgi:hypothetical protein